MTGDVVRLACLALMFGLAAVPAAAEEFYGPLRIRDMGPFQILRLNMLPDHALAPSAGRVGLEFQVSHSNTFVMDTDIHAYLERRGARGEIGPRDVTAIAALGEDTFLFDGELGYAKATGHYAFTDRLSGYVSVPFHYFGGGYFDSAIENFHDMFGFDSFGREYISRNDFQAVATIDGETFALLERPTSGGIGDPVLGLRYYIPLRNHSAVTFELAHKFAFQDPDKFRTTGSDDSGAQISWHVHGLKNSFYTSVAVVRTGDAEPFPQFTRHVIPSVNLAWERHLLDGVNVIFQVNAARSLFEKGDPELTANVYQASLGLRHRAGRFVWSYALTENLVNFNNTADLGFHVGFAWMPEVDGH